MLCLVILDPNLLVKKELTDEITAIDDGGPTREFFSRIFDQLGAIKVDKIALFEMTKYGYMPVSDDKLESFSKDRETKDKIKNYYRAIGRIFAHCLVRRITISSNTLPVFYWNGKFNQI